MNSDYIQTVVDETIKTVSCRYEKNGKEYTFKTRLDLKVGDQVLVQTAKAKVDFDFEDDEIQSIARATRKRAKVRGSATANAAVTKVLNRVKPSFAIVEVVEIHETPDIEADSDIDYKWILQKVDVEAYIEAAENDDKFRISLRDKARETHRTEARARLAELYGTSSVNELAQLMNSDES